MAERYDERFDEITGLVKKVAGRVDEVQLEVRDMRKEMREMSSEVSEHSSSFDKLETAVQIASGQQKDVISKVVGIQRTVNRISERQSEQTFKIIEILNRLNVVEIHLRSLGDETNGMKLEIKEVRAAVHSFIDPIQIGWDLRENLVEVERRVTNIEQKLAK